jgi:hypothetical protein
VYSNEYEGNSYKLNFIAEFYKKAVKSVGYFRKPSGTFAVISLTGGAQDFET